MKRLLVVALVVLMVSPAALAGNRKRKGGSSRGSGTAAALADLPAQTVDDEERADLLFLREEEKLARDVYLAMSAQWGTRVFKNIAKAEQKHMDAVLVLLRKYSIPDPAAGNGEGVFTDASLQALFTALVAKGMTSLEDALVVGATIEDMDIADLTQSLAVTDNEDIATLHQNLLRGSRNHLRAFDKLMDRYDVAYDAQYITPAEYDEIVNSSKEKGDVDAQGQRVRGRKGQRRGK